jgi:hypothetical protein
MKAMLEARMVAAITQAPYLGDASTHGFARITASSQGGLAKLAITHSHKDLRGQAVRGARALISGRRSFKPSDGAKTASATEGTDFGLHVHTKPEMRSGALSVNIGVSL